MIDPKADPLEKLLLCFNWKGKGLSMHMWLCDYVHGIIEERKERKGIHGPSFFVTVNPCDQLRVQPN